MPHHTFPSITIEESRTNPLILILQPPMLLLLTATLTNLNQRSPLECTKNDISCTLHAPYWRLLLEPNIIILQPSFYS
jgi:hypothetical protein